MSSMFFYTATHNTFAYVAEVVVVIVEFIREILDPL